MRMIKISKGKEPVQWTNYCATPGVTYKSNPQLKDALLAEQGYICAYCMRSIPLVKNDKDERESSKIEHIKCRSNHRNLELDYDNMVICCPGNIDGNYHCDKSKGDKDISLPVFNIMLEQSISYSSIDGEIKSSDENWDSEINNIICLNNELLKYNRKQALEGIIDELKKTNWKHAKIQSKFNEYSNLDSNGKHKPFCGIIIWYLKKKLKQL